MGFKDNHGFSENELKKLQKIQNEQGSHVTLADLAGGGARGFMPDREKDGSVSEEALFAARDLSIPKSESSGINDNWDPYEKLKRLGLL